MSYNGFCFLDHGNVIDDNCFRVLIFSVHVNRMFGELSVLIECSYASATLLFCSNVGKVPHFHFLKNAGLRNFPARRLISLLSREKWSLAAID